MEQLVTHTPGWMEGLAPLLPLALPRPPLPDSPAPLGLLLPGKPEPRPCRGETKQTLRHRLHRRHRLRGTLWKHTHTNAHTNFLTHTHTLLDTRRHTRTKNLLDKRTNFLTHTDTHTHTHTKNLLDKRTNFLTYTHTHTLLETRRHTRTKNLLDNRQTF